MILKELYDRVSCYKEQEGDLQFDFTEQIPLTELYEAIEHHFDIRKKIADNKKLINERTY